LGHLGGRVLRAGDDEDAVLDREPAVVGGGISGKLGATQLPAGEVLPVKDRFELRLVGTGDGEDEHQDEEGEKGRSNSVSMNQSHHEAPGMDRTPPSLSLPTNRTDASSPGRVPPEDEQRHVGLYGHG